MSDILNIDTLASKIAGLLIRIHYSLEKNVPITRRFIEHRGAIGAL